MLKPNSTSSNKKNHAVAQLVEAQLYKPKVNGFDSLWVIGISYRINSASRTMTLGST
jgi:hypothetical protein